MLNTPVLLLVFNRIDTAEQVLNRIREAQPAQLFIAADGPRPDKVGEIERCTQVRETILASIDWVCEVHTLFQEKNLGSGKAISSAINWFFLHVESGIILEDDCLPDSSFFSFCENALSFYKNFDKVMHVSGGNWQCGIKRGSDKYYFSKIPSTWGWATWRRAWEKYSYDFFNDSDSEISSVLSNSLSEASDVEHYMSAFNKTKTRQIDAWDYQWLYTVFKNDGISVTPEYNLITNMGFNSGGTHTFSAPYWYKYLITKPVENVVFHKVININKKADIFFLDLIMYRQNYSIKVVSFLYKWRNRYSKVSKLFFK